MTTLICWLESHQHLSGWAQALGSFIALFIAIAVPYRQTRAAREEAREIARKEARDKKLAIMDQVEKLYALGLFASKALGKLSQITKGRDIDAIVETFDETHSRSELKNVVSSFNQVPMFELPNASFVTIGLQLREACNAGVESFEDYLSGLRNYNSTQVGSSYGRLETATKKIEQLLEQLASARLELITELELERYLKI